MSDLVKIGKKEERKYLVVKQKVLDNYFSQFVSGTFATQKEHKYIDRIPFFKVLRDIRKETEGKKYIVCNQDEPYAELIWKIILDGETAKLNKKSFNPVYLPSGLEIEYLREWYQKKTNKYLKSKLSSIEINRIFHMLFIELTRNKKE